MPPDIKNEEQDQCHTDNQSPWKQYLQTMEDQ